MTAQQSCGLKDAGWQPSAELAVLKQRAQLLASIRAFFKVRDVLEVQTPILSQASVTDVALKSLTTQVGAKPYFLQTSPEFAMKRLLAAGIGSIYQICQVFRDDEQGRFHNPEFTLLEWYRVGFNDRDLMQEMDLFLQETLACQPSEYLSYEAAFLQYLDLNPHTVTLNELRVCAEQHQLTIVGLAESELQDRDLWLQLLLSELIEPHLGQNCPCFLYDFPATQAALAKTDGVVAKRFEVYYRGVELANGFDELRDGKQQRARFEQDIAKRQQLAINDAVNIDERFLAALESQPGLPDCAGVALGIDRLLMLKMGCEQISDVIAFDIERA